MGDRVELHLGDCIEVMREFKAESIETCITDPPYGLKFMGKGWDKGVPGIAYWEAVKRVLRPGALLLAFGGTRTWHRLGCAIEDGGFEIIDTLMWVYGSGFPKSHDVAGAIDKRHGYPDRGHRIATASRHHPDGTFEPNGDNLPAYEAKSSEAQPWQGWGTQLKPAWEPIIVAMKPIDGTYAHNAERWGVAGFHIDGARVGYVDEADKVAALAGDAFKRKDTHDKQGWARPWMDDPEVVARVNAESKARAQQGRWPANFIHDGSPEVMELFPDAPGQQADVRGDEPSAPAKNCYGTFARSPSAKIRSDRGSAGRFFYCPKASRAEREEGLQDLPKRFLATLGDGIGEREHNESEPAAWVRNNHPTVKPLALMRYLCRLTMTPTSGTVLDPFLGSGTTCKAAYLEGRDSIGIENDPGYFAIAEAKIASVRAQLRLPMSERMDETQDGDSETPVRGSETRACETEDGELPNRGDLASILQSQRLFD